MSPQQFKWFLKTNTKLLLNVNSSVSGPISLNETTNIFPNSYFNVSGKKESITDNPWGLEMTNVSKFYTSI